MMTKIPIRLIGSALVLLANLAIADHPSVGLTTGNASPITTTSANSLPRGQWSFGFQFEYNDNDTISDSTLIANAEADEESDVHSVGALDQYSLFFAAGLSDKFYNSCTNSLC